MDREALNDYPLGLYDVTVEIVTSERDSAGFDPPVALRHRLPQLVRLGSARRGDHGRGQRRAWRGQMT
jgi:hypothetical protein